MMNNKDHMKYHHDIQNIEYTDEIYTEVGNGNVELVDNLNKFCRDHNLNRSNIKYNHSRGYKAELLHNHKVVSIKFLDEKMTLGALTIDQNETYHSHHTYLLDAGIYTKNTMLEDFWLARREGGRGTQIEILPGGQNLNQIDDIIFFQRLLFRALSVPITRLDPEAMFNYGRANEITRDEVIFMKFIDRLRDKFSQLFKKTMGKQVVLKNIMTPEEWDSIQHLIEFIWAADSYFEEIKNAEIMTERFNLLEVAMPFVGRYYSNKFIRKNLLFQTDEMIKTEDEEIVSELDNPLYQQSVTPEGMPIPPMAADPENPTGRPEPPSKPAPKPAPAKPAKVDVTVNLGGKTANKGTKKPKKTK